MFSDEVRITINPLDYIPPRNYVRLLFPIELKEGTNPKVVFDDLHFALHKTFVQDPWISGKVFRQSSDSDGWRPGQLEIRHRPYLLEGPWPYQLRYLQLETDMTYSDLKDSGFPAGLFPEELLLNAPIVGDVDTVGADIFLAQANFLPGGLLLGMTVFHAALDAASMLNVTKQWAENFRELHGRDAGGEVAPSRFTANDCDKTLPERLWKRETGGKGPNRTDDPWLRRLVALDADYPGEDITGATQKALTAAKRNNTSNGYGVNGSSIKGFFPQDETINGDAHPPRHPNVMLNRVMFLSEADLAALHKDCTAEPSPPGTSPVSISDAINALLWRGSLRARSTAAKARNITLDAMSVFESPVDVRNVFALDFPNDFLGNCFVLNSASMPLVELISPSTSLGRIAQILRQGAARIDSKAVHDAYSLIRSTPDLSRVQGRFVERPESADMLISNIIFFPMSELNFGDRYFENSGQPHALRVLHAMYAPYVRLGHVLPKNPHHGGVELSVNLFDDEMAYLDEDEEFNRYAVAIEL